MYHGGDYTRKPVLRGRNTLDQLRLICTHIGKPPSEMVNNPEALDKLHGLPDGSLEVTELVPGLTDPEAIDILTKMWELDPAKRQSAAELLQHPFLAALHDEQDEPECPTLFSWPYEQKEMNDSLLRRAFWEEICAFNPQLKSQMPLLLLSKCGAKLIRLYLIHVCIPRSVSRHIHVCLRVFRSIVFIPFYVLFVGLIWFYFCCFFVYILLFFIFLWLVGWCC
ncbi:putative mitogen-activated protein kinase 3 [Trypanosoma cruzi]|uniref:Putative mitogen-activated protein kinase 3 n=1 Tax=Trypanosoma cruzi TaxID=5693 RepID=A0A2V2WBF7_TRYCR|nr:putative mitogen-activated protein kinase 3 [Trypanosoma cruzi]